MMLDLIDLVRVFGPHAPQPLDSEMLRRNLLLRGANPAVG